MRCENCGGALPRVGGVGRPARFCSDNCRKRAWERENYRGMCETCGALTWGRQTTRCFQHSDVRDIAEAKRRRVVALWAEGRTFSQIAAVMGWGTKNQARSEIARMRRLGYDLPYRRTPEQVARIRAGSEAGRRRVREMAS